jgi:hypothetical protein
VEEEAGAEVAEAAAVEVAVSLARAKVVAVA